MTSPAGTHTFNKLKTQSLRMQVYVKLKEKLLSGEWKSGEKLPSENELCKIFGVSRVTVRAAVQQLEILGLLEICHGGGTFVRDFSSIDAAGAFHPLIQINKNQDIITVLEYRQIVEKGMTGLAFERMNQDDIQALELIYEQMNNSQNDIKSYSEADLDFHYYIAKMSRNPMIVKVYSMINEILSQAMVDIVGLLGCKDGIKYHRQIIDSFKSGDKQKTENLIAEHIDVTIRRIKESSNGSMIF